MKTTQMTQITLKELFNKAKEKYNLDFPLDTMVEVPGDLYTTNEKGNEVKVTYMIVKEDEIYEVTFENGITELVGKGHLFSTPNGLFRVKDIEPGDFVETLGGNLKVTDIKPTGKIEKVYDIGVDNKTHLYSDPNGIIHHNTYGMEQKLKKMFGEFNLPESKVVYLKGGSISTFGLYKLLYANRDGKIIVLDDSDALLRDRAIVNMLKSAMDSYPVREISWESNIVMPMNSLSKEDREEYYAKIDQALSDPEKAGKVGGKLKMPGSFPFTSKIFFISNMSLKDWTKDARLQAIWSRSVHVNVDIDKDGVKKRILKIIDHIEPNVPKDVKLELLETLYNENPILNIRVFASACQMKGAVLAQKADLSDEEVERFAAMYV